MWFQLFAGSAQVVQFLLLPHKCEELIRASLRLPQCVQLWGWGGSLFTGPKKFEYISDFVCVKYNVCMLCVKSAQIPRVCTVSPDIFSITIEFFHTNSSIYQFTCTEQKAPCNRFTDHSKIAGSQYRTCFISSSQCLEFGGGLQNFGKFVDPLLFVNCLLRTTNLQGLKLYFCIGHRNVLSWPWN